MIPETPQPGTKAKRSRLRRAAIAILGVSVVLYSLWVTAIVSLQDKLVFPGALRPPPKTTGPTDPSIEQIWITAKDGSRVEAWYKPGRGVGVDNPGPAVIICHGNDDWVDRRWPWAEKYVEMGVSAMVIEFRGYWRSDGEPSQEAVTEDAIAFHDLLVKRLEVDPSRIVFHGHSVGGGVAVALADHREPAAMVLECTFTSVVAMAKQFGVPGFFCRHPFRSDRVLAKLDVPIAIFHGNKDEIIPFEHGPALHAIAKNSRFTELDCGHANFRNDWPGIRRFLVDVGILKPTE